MRNLHSDLREFLDMKKGKKHLLLLEAVELAKNPLSEQSGFHKGASKLSGNARKAFLEKRTVEITGKPKKKRDASDYRRACISLMEKISVDAPLAFEENMTDAVFESIVKKLAPEEVNYFVDRFDASIEVLRKFRRRLIDANA